MKDNIVQLKTAKNSDLQSNINLAKKQGVNFIFLHHYSMMIVFPNIIDKKVGIGWLLFYLKLPPVAEIRQALEVPFVKKRQDYIILDSAGISRDIAIRKVIDLIQGASHLQISFKEEFGTFCEYFEKYMQELNNSPDTKDAPNKIELLRNSIIENYSRELDIDLSYFKGNII